MRNIFMTTHFRWILGILILCAGTAGCSRFGSKAGEEEAQPPDYIKISAVGIARSDANNLPALFAAALAGTLKADATAPHDSQLPDPAQRVLLARAEARRAALRALGQNLLDLPDKNGHLLSEFLKETPDKKVALNELIESEARIGYQERESVCQATASLDGRRALEVLGRPTPGQANKSETLTPDQLEKRKRQSYDMAFDEVKKKLREELDRILLPDGRTIQAALAKDASARQELDALIFLTRPDDVHYTSDGSCALTLFFDRNLAIALATRAGHHGWRPW